MRTLPVLLLLCLCGSAHSETPDFIRDIRPLLETHCFDCHGDEEEPKGGVSLEHFQNDADAMQDRHVWAVVFEKLESHQMPPPKRNSQPASEEREKMLAWIADLAARPDPALGAPDPGKPVLRRLTRLEYNNTLRDLFGLSRDLFMFPDRLPLEKYYFHPEAKVMASRLEVPVREYGGKYPVLLNEGGLPGDSRAEYGFTNRGDAMNLSPLLLEQYVSIAQQIIQSPRLPEQSAVFRDLIADPADAAPTQKQEAAARRLRDFMPRLFRRPVEDALVNRYLEVFTEAIATETTFAEAMKRTLAIMLASPEFLYLSEAKTSEPQAVRTLPAHELAARLSYFLWASAPDEALQKSANSGALLQPDELERQVRRMLADPRVRELSESFAVQWLKLDQLYTSKPDADLFKSFYAGPQGKDTLHAAQMIEALLLFETVLVEDRSILEFVDADYTWLNPRLASFYGLPLETKIAEVEPTVAGQPNRELTKAEKNANNFWQRVKLPDKNRGGFFTMGASLTVTSLPFRTSPVKRGAWLLEAVFNRPPQEPKVAFAVENDTKEAAQTMSIRERFEAHRSKAACYSCHVRLDPPGFALERFDAVGAWREKDGGNPVDARAEWNGQPFDGPAGFKTALMKNPAEFTRGFIEHLLSYALNRKLELYDQPVVLAIQRAAAEDGQRFSRVVLEIVKSYPFRHTRNTAE